MGMKCDLFEVDLFDIWSVNCPSLPFFTLALTMGQVSLSGVILADIMVIYFSDANRRRSVN